MRIYRGLFVSFLFISLFFNSCSDYEPSEKTFIFTGQISAGNAVPAALLEDSDEKRSALPSFGNLDYYAFAKRKDNSQKVNAKIENSSGAMRSFTLSLSQGEWIIECGLKERNPDVTAYCSTKEVEIADEDTFSNLFILKPRVNGSGRINLPFAIDGAINIDDITLINVKKDRQLLSDEELESFYASLEDFKTGSPGIKTKTDATLPAGIYEITINFMRNGYPVYSLTQSISVFADFITDKWISSGTSPSLDPDSGGLKITETLVNSFYDSSIYVGKVGEKEGDDDNGNGTVFAPYKTLNRAFTKIKDSGISTADYVIRVSGSVSGTSVLDSDITEENANSILITGAGSAGTTVDALNGNGEGNTLEITSSVPVRLKNIKITGAKADCAGLVINENAKNVTFEGGLNFTGNTSLDINAREDFYVKEYSSLGKVNLLKDKKLIVAGEINSSSKLAAFVLADCVRRQPVVACDGTEVTSLVSYKALFEPEDGMKIAVASDNKELLIDFPIYVAGTGNKSDTHPFSDEPGSDENNDIGSLKKPFKTIAKALSIMDDGDCDYEIVVAGILNEKQVISDSFTKAKAKSLTIKGKDGYFNAMINAGLLQAEAQGACLVINSAVPITISNMTFKGGNTTGNGGGISIVSASADVTLSEVLIKENNALWGGGISNDGKLTLRASASISGNKAIVDSAENVAKGGGVYNTGKLIMEGGSISGNKTLNVDGKTVSGDGGGLYSSGTFEFNGGSISGNSAGNGGGIYNNAGSVFVSGKAIVGESKGGTISGTNCSNYAAGCGGGIYSGGSNNKLYIGYTDENTKNTTSDCKIVGNYSASNGGGVFTDNSNEVFNFAAGSVEDNKAESYGGAVYFGNNFTILENAKITQNSSNNDVYVSSNNDVYVSSNNAVTIGSKLNKASSIRITPDEYVEKKSVFSIADGADVTIADCLSKFSFSDSDWTFLSDGKMYKMTFTSNASTTSSITMNDNGGTKNLTSSSNSAQLDINTQEGTGDFNYTLRLKDFSRDGGDWASALVIYNTNSNTTVTVTMCLEGNNKLIGGNHGGIKFYGGDGNPSNNVVKLVLDTTAKGSLSFKSQSVKCFQKEKVSTSSSVILAEGCSFTGTINGTVYTDCNAFFNTAATVVNKECSFTITRP